MELKHKDIEALAGMIAGQITVLSSGARWIKLKDAACYSAIGKQKLKQLAENGIITGFSDPDSKRGDWIFDRLSLDTYRENQAGQLRQEVLAHMERL